MRGDLWRGLNEHAPWRSFVKIAIFLILKRMLLQRAYCISKSKTMCIFTGICCELHTMWRFSIIYLKLHHPVILWRTMGQRMTTQGVTSRSHGMAGSSRGVQSLDGTRLGVQSLQTTTLMDCGVTVEVKYHIHKSLALARFYQTGGLGY